MDYGWESDLRESYKQSVRESMYDFEKKNYNSKRTSKDLYFDFCRAVVTRLSLDNLNHTKNYKIYPKAKENFAMHSTNDGASYCSKLLLWIDTQIENGVLSEQITYDYLLKQPYINVLEDYIDNYIIKYVRSIHTPNYKPVVFKEEKAPEVEAIKEEVIIPEVITEEPPKKKSNAGRPKGSKNKKPEKELYMPHHTVLNNKDEFIDLIVKAIADLVWRKEGMMDSNYLEYIELTDKQKKYINFLLINKSPLIENKYWKVEKKGKVNTIIPIMKRAGYYTKPPGGKYDLYSLTYISNLTNVPKNTLIYKLKHMSVNDAVRKKV